MTDVIAISGSPFPSSRGDQALDTALAPARERGLRIDRVAVRDLPAAALLGAQSDDATIAAAIARVGSASAVVVTTPVYKGVYTGLLKSFLDLLPAQALADAAATGLITGASPHHADSATAAVDSLLAELGATRQLPALYLTDRELPRADNGQILVGDDQVRERLHRLGGWLESI